MTKHDFSPLYEQYPTIIKQMPDVFTSHEFILALAQQNQTKYIEALYTYCYNDDGELPEPFMIVHGILARYLNSFPELIEKLRNDAPSTDIFGHSNECAEWKKVS